MKKIVLTLVAMMSLTVAIAQNNMPPRKVSPADMTAQMKQQLALTDEQEVKVQALNEQYADLMIGLAGRGRHPLRGRFGRPRAEGDSTFRRPQFTPEMKEQMEKVRARRQEYRKQLKEILTPEQLTTYQNTFRR